LQRGAAHSFAFFALHFILLGFTHITVSTFRNHPFRMTDLPCYSIPTWLQMCRSRTSSSTSFPQKVRHR
jgi:hypothetical protein